MLLRALSYLTVVTELLFSPFIDEDSAGRRYLFALRSYMAKKWVSWDLNLSPTGVKAHAHTFDTMTWGQQA